MTCTCGGAGRCGCCQGVEAVTPVPIFNRPGLSAIRWRVGEHRDFFATMLAGISGVWVDVETGEVGAHGRTRKRRELPLHRLRTREADDPSIALLDSWAVVSDILSFYTDRIAAEGYLWTATELRSLIELGRLVGYRRRPGVAASVYLAFTADDSWTRPVVVMPGARVQSLPEPGEAPVLFETDAPITARAELNALAPRQERPSYLPRSVADSVAVVYFAGTATRLSPGRALLLSYGATAVDQVLRLVASVEEDFTADRTRVTLQGGVEPGGPGVRRPRRVVDPDDLVRELERPPSSPPASPARLRRPPGAAFRPGSTAVDALVRVFHPDAAEAYAAARAKADVTAPSELDAVWALRVKASIYGHTAPPPPVEAGEVEEGAAPPADWTFAHPTDLVAPDGEELAEFRRRVLDLDTTYEAIVPDTWVIVQRPEPGRPEGVTVTTRVRQVQTASRTDYNLPAKVTRLVLDDAWLPEEQDERRLQLSDVRSTVVLAAPELLALGDEPVYAPLCGDDLELDRQVEGLEPGRWLVVTGARVTVAAADGPEGVTTTGVSASELTMLADVRQDTLWVDADGNVVPPPAPQPTVANAQGPLVALPGDRIHTFLRLATPLAYCYQRDTVRIYANVAHATHGETHAEPLGSGDSSKRFASFTLKSDPLTYVAAPTTDGVRSSLEVYVDGIRWHEAHSLLDLGPTDHGYVTSADHDERTTVTFGDGLNGSRLSRGVENVRSVYRSGIGPGGNVRAGQLSQLVTSTEGLRGVTNPQRASGGAAPDGPDRIRVRAPLAVASLDRLVATRDYADFALLFAGVGKASAARLPSRHGQLVQITMAGVDDIPIDPTSDLQRGLLEALGRYGDPYLPVRVVRRELLALVIGARIRLDADRVWEVVRPQVEAALLARFGFERRDLGQDAYAAEALAAMHAVPGVDYVDLDVFTAVPETTTVSDLAALGAGLTEVQDRIVALGDRSDPGRQAWLPAQLAVLLTGAASTVFLTEITDA